VDRERRGEPVIQFGIGVPHREVVLGAVGLPERSDYTAIGDTVNTASRMESLTKDSTWTPVLSSETAGRLDGDERRAAAARRGDGPRQSCGRAHLHAEVVSAMPQLDAIGIVSADLKATVRFYRLVGLQIPDTTEDHIDVTTPGGVRVMFDALELIKQLDPEWVKPAGHPMPSPSAASTRKRSTRSTGA
jgi:hypothetical protein